MTSRTTRIAVPLAAAALLTGNVSASAISAPSRTTSTSVATVAEVGQSSFRAASVSYRSGTYRISWDSTDPRVTIVANHAPQTAEPGAVVAQGKASGAVDVDNLSADGRWYFHLRGSRGDSVVVALRSLGFVDDANLRDLGGYRTEDGKWVKNGLLFRGAQMSDLTPAESSSLTALDLAYDVDMRTPGEVAHHPDVVPAGATYIAHSVLLPDDPSATGVLPGLDDAEYLRMAGYSTGYYKSLYLKMGGGTAETFAYRQIFHDILAANGRPLLFHCTAGDDRTGWLSFVLLKILGVSDKDALNDYLLSNVYGQQLLQGYSDYYVGLGFTPEQSYFFLKQAYVATAMRSAEVVYGSFANYVRLGLGLSSADIAKLRATYLAS